jgi:hypothetical protein
VLPGGDQLVKPVLAGRVAAAADDDRLSRGCPPQALEAVPGVQQRRPCAGDLIEPAVTRRDGTAIPDQVTWLRSRLSAAVKALGPRERRQVGEAVEAVPRLAGDILAAQEHAADHLALAEGKDLHRWSVLDDE